MRVGGRLFYKNASVAIIDKKNFNTKTFLWHYFLRCHVALGPWEPAQNVGI